MNLLIITQAVDSEDPVLGFFVRWIEEFSKRVEHTEVICLKLGRSDLPKNVGIHSLGKERGAASRAAYAWRFLSLAWKLRNDYDAVFVHMNQEYILLGGWLWRLFGKRVYLWRNHYSGSFLTDIAAVFCTRIFCTSRHSYTARYKKTMLMPVGVDTGRFFPDPRIARTPHSILFLARMSPSKRPEMLIDALDLLAREGVTFTASFVGSPLPQDEVYYEGLKEKVRVLDLADRILFLPGVPNDQTPDLYRAHEVFVNASPSGMFDKTIFEAAVCGCEVVTASEDWKELMSEEYFFSGTAPLAARLKGIFSQSVIHENIREKQESLATAQGLPVLADQLIAVLAAHEYPRHFRSFVWVVLAAFARVLPHSPRMTVLLYHSISRSPDFFAVPPERFERQMRYVRKHFDVVPLSRAFAHAAGERVERDSVAVTFDDGYRDFATEALPILERYGIPATVFVIGGRPSAGELGNEHTRLAIADAPTLSDALVSVGSHTLTHRKLTKLSPEEACEEMLGSRTAVKKEFGVMPEYLSYPKGSHNERVMQGAASAGYTGAVTVVERGVRNGDSPFALPRIQVDASVSPALFKAKLSPAADWYYACWSLLKRLKGK